MPCAANPLEFRKHSVGLRRMQMLSQMTAAGSATGARILLVLLAAHLIGSPSAGQGPSKGTGEPDKNSQPIRTLGTDRMRHNGRAYSAVFTSDGSQLISFGDDD